MTTGSMDDAAVFAPRETWTDAAADVAAVAADEAGRADTFPAAGFARLVASGLLDLPFAEDGDPAGGTDVLRTVLTLLGRGSLSLARLYEGHVNAVALVARYGTAANLALLRHEVRQGRASGVWMAGPPLRLDAGERLVLRGRKILCSGAGHWRRPLVAADSEAGSILLLPDLSDAARADVSAWTPQGMGVTATGTVDFDGIAIGADEIVGQPGDYLRSPWFRGGAWRVIAVQLGGVEALMAQYATQLRASPHRDHPIQLARFGEALIAARTARLWVDEAARVAEGDGDPQAIDAFVDLARNAFEAAALRVVALAQKAIGLEALMRPNPIERIARDLTTYLRQPALDASLMSAAAFHLAERG